jgi:choice-of-anchor B domain-containing protein
MIKKLLFLLVIFALYSGVNAQHASQNILQMSNWYDTTVLAEPYYGIKYSGVWGWVDPADNKEYAIIGSTAGTYIIEVTDPYNPVQRAYVAGRRDQCIWREIKTYENYLYLVSDDQVPNSFQIVDLSYLPDSVHIVHDSDSIFARSHTIYVDNGKLYCASVTRPSIGFYSMAVYDLTADPTNPTLLRTLNQDYSTPSSMHDMFVRNDTVYASGGYDGFFVYKEDSITHAFSLIGSITSYLDQGYNHSSFITKDGKTLIFVDEVPAGMGVKTYDISDFSNMQFQSLFYSNPGATPHNPYFTKDDMLVISYYADGLVIYDVSDPANPVRVGYYDTNSNDPFGGPYTSPAYQGAWGAFPDLPSGNILVSDMQEGLFVLDADVALSRANTATFESQVKVFPTIFTDQLSVTLARKTESPVICTLTDISGKVLVSKTYSGSNISMNIPTELSSGFYFLQVTEGNNYATFKVVKQ